MIVIRGIGLPCTVLGVTLPGADGDFYVYINTNVCEAKQKEAITHEIKHIELDHFYNDDPVIYNELEAG